MHLWKLLLLLFVFTLPLHAENEQLRVHVLEKIKVAPPGSIITVPIQTSNYSSHPLTLVNHLEIGGGMAPLPENYLMTHLNAGQVYQQQLRIKIPENTPPGAYHYFYQIVSETDVNVFEQDEGTIIVEEIDENPIYKQTESIISTENSLEAAPDEMLFLSFVIKNPLGKAADCSFKLRTPSGWSVAGFADEQLHIEEGESTLQLLGVKVPKNALAHTFSLFADVTGDFEYREEIQVSIKPVSNFSARVDLNPEGYSIICENGSNTPLKIYLRSTTDPVCPLSYDDGLLTIPAFDTLYVPFSIDIDRSTDETKQFVQFQIFKEDCSEPLFQVPFSIDLVPDACCDDDPFVRIPSQIRTMVLGENSQTVGVIELSGAGVIDTERNRTLEYCIRLPTNSRNVIYSVDQRLYLGLSDPNWDLDLGDTVYDLTPLTQYYRYGRGLGFEAGANGFNCGAHYTQNTFSNDYNPRETCAFVNYSRFPEFSASINYLHKVLEEIPTSNIVTLESTLEPLPNIQVELEAGNNYLKKSARHDTHAYRGEMRGRIFHDTWFDIEKVYAGQDFYGYYQAMNLFTSTLDTPITKPLRANISYTSLRQNFAALDPDDPETFSPRQKQTSATLTYSFANGAALSLNGLYLRAREAGVTEDYNFTQKWGGVNFLYVADGYTVNSSIGIGQQKDYLTGKSTHCLQRYYSYLGKEFSDKIYASCFYEGGHIDYFNVLPWRTSYGATLRYRYQSCSWCDLFVQKVRHRHDDYQMSQISFNLHHQFANRHSMDVSLQRFIYKKHYPSDSFFLVSYTIPLGIPLWEKGDRGELSGFVFDHCNQCPVPNAIVNLNGKQIRTDAQGRFCFPRTPIGAQTLKTDLLPGNLMPQEAQASTIQIQKGKNNPVMLACVPSTSIQGDVRLYAFAEDNPFQDDSTLVEAGGLESVRITIDLDHGKEIYTCLTDKNGKFRFPRLRPGAWRVYITPDYLPNLHHLNMNDVIVDLEPGQEQTLSIKVLPEKRVMQRL